MSARFDPLRRARGPVAPRPTPETVDDLEYPCVRNCCLDDQDVCLGCHRNLADILGWRAMTVEQRTTAMEAARSRQRMR